MTGLGLVLRSLGVNISEEHIRGMEVLIPQIPAKVQQVIVAVNATIERIDNRELAVEERLTMLLNVLKETVHTMSGYYECTIKNQQTLLDQLSRIENHLQKVEATLDVIRNWDIQRTDSTVRPNGADYNIIGTSDSGSAKTRRITRKQ
jgi:hypothetical protein